MCNVNVLFCSSKIILIFLFLDLRDFGANQYDCLHSPYSNIENVFFHHISSSIIKIPDQRKNMWLYANYCLPKTEDSNCQLKYILQYSHAPSLASDVGIKAVLNYLTAPEVTPSTMKRCRNRYRIRIGSIASSRAAMINPRSVENVP